MCCDCRYICMLHCLIVTFYNSISPSATTNSRFSTPGARSLPLTPPGVLERPTVAISCPDGLAHALSEQNLRLQQIVYEHKVVFLSCY